MNAISRLVLVLPLILAAAPKHVRPLPVPPIPPAHRPTDGPAPTPDRDAAAPSAPSSDGPKLTPRIVQVPTYQNTFDRSEGYITGSRATEDFAADRRLMPSPGFYFQVPFK
jgi:hypothetical protein